MGHTQYGVFLYHIYGTMTHYLIFSTPRQTVIDELPD